MEAFDKIIGYDEVKQELKQFGDILSNSEIYEKLGVTEPRGLLLYGKPGVGKTLMAEALIKSSGRHAYICRKNEPNGKFVETIKKTFAEAAENEPSIVFLDDMDKFTNGDEDHRDAEEYVMVQSCIDEVRGKRVFVLATANEIHCLPHSLLRAGRFDRKIKIMAPSGEDAANIIDHYLKRKTMVSDVDPTLLARLMKGSSCAALETVINEAGIYAGMERADSITMEHIVRACMKVIYEVSYCSEEENRNCTGEEISFDKNLYRAYHEAGHAVVSEVLSPQSVTIVSVLGSLANQNSGFTVYYREGLEQDVYHMEIRIITSLAGMAAMEQRFGIADTGASKDLDQAFEDCSYLVQDVCIRGTHLYAYGFRNSQNVQSGQEHAIAQEIERYYQKAKQILALNRDFLDKTAEALRKKKVLLQDDIREIKSKCKIMTVSL